MVNLSRVFEEEKEPPHQESIGESSDKKATNVSHIEYPIKLRVVIIREDDGVWRVAVVH